MCFSDRPRRTHFFSPVLSFFAIIASHKRILSLTIRLLIAICCGSPLLPLPLPRWSCFSIGWNDTIDSLQRKLHRKTMPQLPLLLFPPYCICVRRSCWSRTTGYCISGCILGNKIMIQYVEHNANSRNNGFWITQNRSEGWRVFSAKMV